MPARLVSKKWSPALIYYLRGKRTQDEFARLIGAPKNTVWRWEAGYAKPAAAYQKKTFRPCGPGTIPDGLAAGRLTHPLIWYASGKHSRLSGRVVRIFETAFADRALIVIPSPVLWEISLLAGHGKIAVREPFEQWAAALISRKGIELAALDLDVIAEARRLTFHGDPFDRAIVATARLMDLPLITKDEIIVDSKLVEIVW